MERYASNVDNSFRRTLGWSGCMQGFVAAGSLGKTRKKPWKKKERWYNYAQKEKFIDT